MNDLVKRLSEKDHKVQVVLHPDRTVQAFKQCVDRGYVRVKFADTRGGTELGVRLDSSVDELKQTDFEKQSVVTLSGRLKLDFVPVRCVAKIDLKTMEGLGHLEVISPEA